MNIKSNAFFEPRKQRFGQDSRKQQGGMESAPFWSYHQFASTLFFDCITPSALL